MELVLNKTDIGGMREDEEDWGPDQPVSTPTLSNIFSLLGQAGNHLTDEPIILVRLFLIIKSKKYYQLL